MDSSDQVRTIANVNSIFGAPFDLLVIAVRPFHSWDNSMARLICFATAYRHCSSIAQMCELAMRTFAARNFTKSCVEQFAKSDHGLRAAWLELELRRLTHERH